MHFPAMVRKRMVELYHDESMAVAEIAEVFGASCSGVRRVLPRYLERGTHLPLPQNPGRKLQLSEPIAAQIHALLAVRPDATRQQIKETLRLTVSLQAISEWVARAGLRLKK